MARASVKEDIVESALREFHRRGFNGCSVEDITKGAGVPKGSFYNHFTSKEELAAEAVRRYAELSAWRRPVPDGLSPLAELHARFAATRTAIAAKEFDRGCLLGNLGTEVSTQSPVIRTEVQLSLDGWSHRIATALREAQAAGELAATADADRLGRFLVDAWQGAVSRSKVERHAGPLDDFLTVVFDQLLH